MIILSFTLLIFIMSSDSLSDSGTSEIRTIEKLIEENRMKDLALQKASSLIELLTVEVLPNRCSCLLKNNPNHLS
jgi:hypothetical protein